MDEELNLIEMELREIQMRDNIAAGQIIVLGEKEGAREFPIYIGYNEALALDMALHNVRVERPMTHDLIFNVLESQGARLLHVIVDDLVVDEMHDGTFHGKLAVKTQQGMEVLVDSRPSDAIVLATKRRLPIFVAEHVLEQVAGPAHPEDEPGGVEPDEEE